MKKMLVLTACVLITSACFAQISGNHIYKNNYNYNNSENEIAFSERPVIIKDSIMLVTAQVLVNTKADSLIITLSVSEEAKTVKSANTSINRRINNFKQSLKAMGIVENDTYTDFITQTKIYDYNVSGSNATQFIKGFEIRKNIIIRLPASELFDRVIEAASENEIYDIVKVDYISNQAQKIYAEMMGLASSIIKQKKDAYLQLSPVELLPVPKIASEKFYAVYPDTRYKEYAAFETSDVTTDYSKASLIKKIERKNKTFYYDKISQSGFDLVINNASPVVGIQFVLEIQMKYDLKRN